LWSVSSFVTIRGILPERYLYASSYQATGSTI
jgi:hypothetical protein